jgi:hypothetical protein
MTFEMISLITLADPFRLTAPVYWDNPHEIGYWSASNLITNMKQSLAFVENATTSPAFLCHRVSYNASTWKINASAQIKSGRLHFLFTEDFCKITAINGSYAGWRGIDFVFERIDESNISISFSTSSGIHQNLCSVGSKDGKIGIALTQTAGGIAVSHDGGVECGMTSEKVNSGFFAFVGEIAGADIAKQELFAFAPSPSAYTQESVSYDNYHSRKLFKVLVGRASPKKLRYVVAGSVTPDDVLTGINDGEMTRNNTEIIFEILSEITERAKLALDLQNLKTLLEVSGTIHFLRAEKSIVHRKEETQKIYQSLIELEVFLNESLGTMKNVVAAEASTTDERLVEALEKLLQLETEAQVLTTYSEEANQRWLAWNVLLIAICIVEFLDYVVFFFIRRYQTRNFKID